MMSASQAILRTVEAVIGPVNIRVPALEPGPRASASRSSEPFQQVAVVNGDHYLRAQSSRGGQVSGGKGCLAGSDKAVKEPLRPGALIQPFRWAASARRRRHPSNHPRHRPGCTAVPRRVGTRCGAGPRVGGDVHDREQVFELVCRGEDFQMVQPTACPPDEGALALAQLLLAGFLAVLVQGVRPAFGDPGQEVLVVLGRRPGEGMLHPGGIVGRGHVPDPVEGQADDRRRT